MYDPSPLGDVLILFQVLVYSSTRFQRFFLPWSGQHMLELTVSSLFLEAHTSGLLWVAVYPSSQTSPYGSLAGQWPPQATAKGKY